MPWRNLQQQKSEATKLHDHPSRPSISLEHPPGPGDDPESADLKMGGNQAEHAVEIWRRSGGKLKGYEESASVPLTKKDMDASSEK